MNTKHELPDLGWMNRLMYLGDFFLYKSSKYYSINKEKSSYYLKGLVGGVVCRSNCSCGWILKILCSSLALSTFYCNFAESQFWPILESWPILGSVSRISTRETVSQETYSFSWCDFFSFNIIFFLCYLFLQI